MRDIDKVEVHFADEHVGTMAQIDSRRTAFQYAPSWIENGFSISPISLPLENRLFIAAPEPFDGLFGVFNDSLPDGWGRLITDRHLRKHGIDPNSVTPLTRLSILTPERTGNLHYEPSNGTRMDLKAPDLDALYNETKEILLDKDSGKYIDELFIIGSSSNGARPKIGIQMEGSSWIVKFPSVYDPKDMGVMEYDYNRTARECGIDVPDFKLLESNLCNGFFASKRFDRTPNGKVHMVSTSGLLETSHRIPAMDYRHLFKLSRLISNDTNELQRVFDLMCFNVISHNQDDHSKNFSFLYDADQRVWRLSPAYDLTYSATTWNEQSTTVDGKGKAITIQNLVDLGIQNGLNPNKLAQRANEIQEIVTANLSGYLQQGSVK